MRHCQSSVTPTPLSITAGFRFTSRARLEWSACVRQQQWRPFAAVKLWRARVNLTGESRAGDSRAFYHSKFQRTTDHIVPQAQDIDRSEHGPPAPRKGLTPGMGKSKQNCIRNNNYKNETAKMTRSPAISGGTNGGESLSSPPGWVQHKSAARCGCESEQRG